MKKSFVILISTAMMVALLPFYAFGLEGDAPAPEQSDPAAMSFSETSNEDTADGGSSESVQIETSENDSGESSEVVSDETSGDTGDASGDVSGEVSDGDNGDATDEASEDVPQVLEGWVTEDGKTCYYVNGAKVTGWQKIDGSEYYFNANGVMLTGMRRIGGKVYYLKDGVKTVVKGWLKLGNAKYYGRANGTFANSPIRIKGSKKVTKKVKYKKNGKTKYKNETVTVATNYLYMFGTDGKLITKKGVYKYGGKEYMGLGNGILKTGWAAVKDNAMYFNKSNCKTGTIGSMAKNTKVGYLKIPKSGRLGKAYALGVKKLDKTKWTLYQAYVNSYKLKYRGRWYRTKTSEQYAIRGFTKGYGNCYVMAATFYIQAKLLGYDVHQVQGRVDLPHSWTVIIENGREWVYDPNFRNETGRNGFKIYYGKRGTWRYNHYKKMN